MRRKIVKMNLNPKSKIIILITLGFNYEKRREIK